MDLIVALAISIGVLGGIATWVSLGPLGGILQIWVIFIAWGALLIVTKAGMADSMGLPLWAGIVVGVTVFVLVLLAKVPALNPIPAMVYGYAAVAGFFLLNASADLTAANFNNPLIAVIVSLIVGAVLGLISEKIAGAMAKT
jgi:hypothetical protein